MNNREKIIAAFQDIKRRGFIPSHRTHDTGIGKTFEDLIGIIENNERRPDLNGYEIKTKRETSTSYSTLFTKSPSYPKRANAYLRNRYGEDYEEFPGLKKSTPPYSPTKGTAVTECTLSGSSTIGTAGA